jgi:O-antigen ligase
MAFVFLVAIYVNNERKLALFIKYFIFSSSLALFIALWGAYFEKIPFEEILVAMKSEYIDELEYVNIYRSLTRWTSSFYDPNFYGLYSCLVLIFCLYQKYFSYGGRLLNFFLVANFIALVLTASRTSYLGFAVVAILTLWRIRRIPRNLPWKIFFILLGMILFLLYQTEVRFRIFEPESLQDRWRYIENGIQAFWQSPLLGVSSAGLLNEEIKNPSTHIVYLSLLSKYGIIGFLGYLPFLFYPLYYVIFSKREIEEKYKYLILTTYLSLLVMYLGYDFFQILEFQYLVFGVIYSIVLNKMGTVIEG